MKRLCAIAVCLLLLALQTGCWDEKNPQDVNYVTVLGVDYSDEQKFTIYIQLMDFSSVAKQSEGGGKPTQPTSAWIGRASGGSVLIALSKLEEATQQVTSLDHMMAVVYSESALSRLRETMDTINRFRSVRYNAWIFASSSPLDKLFEVESFFNLSPLATLLYQPQESYRQSSVIPPLTLSEFMSKYREPAGSSFIPSITLTKSHWSKKNKPEDVYTINGAYFTQHGRYSGFFSPKKLEGQKWMIRRLKHYSMPIRKENKLLAVVSVISNKPKVSVRFASGKPLFLIETNIRGVVDEQNVVSSEQEIERLLSAAIRQEIRTTFLEGIGRKTDLLDLEHTLYRKKVGQWKKLVSREPFFLEPDSLEAVKVNVNIVHFGKMKLRR